MKVIKAIEGDYIETKDDHLIFDVKGLKHPSNKIICFIRFYPSLSGVRERNNIKYEKIYDLQDRYAFLKKNYPKYIFYSKLHNMDLQAVEFKDILKVYTPRDYYKKLLSQKDIHNQENKALNLCNLMTQNSKISQDMIGITGSQMIGLSKKNSDIDLIIYGTQNSIDFQEDLIKIFKQQNDCRRYTIEELKSHFKFRAKDSEISFQEFIKYEKRKLHQGKFHDIDFFIRYIKSPENWNEDYYDYRYKDLGKIKLKAKIISAKDSIFTPCKYRIEILRVLECLQEIDQKNIREIISYRGRFCENAKNGELVMVEGKLEKVISKKEKNYFRIILGNNKKDKLLIL